MTALEVLLNRRSIPVHCLTNPGPDAAQIATALDIAMCAPDHGRLQPARFKLVRGAARGKFSDLLVAAALARDPAIPPGQLDKLRQRPLQAPLVIIVSARLREHPKVPEIEQLLSVGASAVNVLNAFFAQGFGAIWLTGPSTYDPAVATSLGLGNEERVIGFIYVGTIGGVVPSAAARAVRGSFVSEF